MDALSNFLGRELIRRISERRAEMLRPLLNGQATDYPDYKHRTGYLKGLSDIADWIEEIRLEDEDRPYGFGPNAGGSRRAPVAGDIP